MAKQGTRILDRRVFYDGQGIFKEGDGGDTAFLIEEGEVRLTKGSGTPNEVEIATVGKGAIFGEMAIFDDQPRMAAATARGTVSAVVIGRAEFDRKLARLGQGEKRFIEELIRYCRKTQIFQERRKSPEEAMETAEDTAIRASLASKYAEAAVRQPDAFLAALIGILIGYARRRLPPD